MEQRAQVAQVIPVAWLTGGGREDINERIAYYEKVLQSARDKGMEAYEEYQRLSEAWRRGDALKSDVQYAQNEWFRHSENAERFEKKIEELKIEKLRSK